MILTYDDIKNICLGCEDIVQTKDGFEFFRFNKEEREIYKQSSIEARTHSTAGIELKFITDAVSMHLSVDVRLCLDRSFFCIDVLKDGELIGDIKNFDDELMTGFYSWSKYPEGKYSGDFDLGEGEKEIRVLLPWSVNCIIEKLELTGATKLLPVKSDKTMLIYGDSITHGYDSRHPGNTYAMKLSSFLGATAHIKAVGGECFWPPLAKAEQNIKPDYISVAYGSNDWGKGSKEDFIKNSSEFLDILSVKYKDAKIFVISPIWRKDHTQENKFGDIRYVHEKLLEMCQSHKNLCYVDGWNLVEHKEELFGDLRLHPNDEGFDQYFNNLTEKIKEFL